MNAQPPVSDTARATETIATRSGVQLLVEKHVDERHVEVSLRTETGRRCVLHWGLRGKDQTAWQILPQALWPEGTTASASAGAMQTPFKKRNGDASIAIALSPTEPFGLIEFVLFFPDEKRWDDNGRRNYQIAVPTASGPGLAPLSALKAQFGDAEVLLERVFEAGTLGQLAAGVTRTANRYRVLLLSDVPGPLALHWGVARRSPHEWLPPAAPLRPPGTVLVDGHTAHTPFVSGDGLQRLVWDFPAADAPLGIQFVLKQGDTGHWLNHRGGNFYIPVVHAASTPAPVLDVAGLADLADRIIQAEIRPSSWTLMHRFNLCFELLDRVRGNVNGLALLYVWLRFSAIRQLTWQRNYNTKPRELSHAQDRLTGRLAELYRDEPNGRPLARLMLATVGRGGDGQRIRDEVLQIMHRHHVKEVTGHFLEEWHQKLHNNTTPDDVVIAEAYLDFLRSNGNLDRFYQTLRENGVTRERLESFERPIRAHPDFVPHLKDGLIHDFENFLRVLKAVHSSTDLETAIQAARDRLDGDTHGLLAQVWNRRNDPVEALVPLVQQITEARRRLSRLLNAGEGLRQLLYLDLALEQLVRVVVERNLHRHPARDALADLTGCVLENVTLSYEDAELAACLRHWERLLSLPRFSALWSLHAKSVTDRIGRALGQWTDRLYQLLQPKAEFLGHGFNAEDWTITLFSEEVVRGSSLGFALSMLLHQLDRQLRQAARLGAWQVISRGNVTGQVEVTPALQAIRGRRFDRPTVVITDQVGGDEEIPENVGAIIAPDVTDLVSHVAVRTRNAQVLFAACSDPPTLDYLKSLHGQQLHLEVTAAGDVRYEKAAEIAAASPPRPRPIRSLAHPPRFTRFAVTMDEFNEDIVGSKSCRLARLRGRLPEWVRLPLSVAVPFGVFEKVLSLAANRPAARRYHELAHDLEDDVPQSQLREQLRETTMSLAAPKELLVALHETCAGAGLPWPADATEAWRCLKRVWASKWNERAVLSRHKAGIPHRNLFMAVLVQPVVEAEYAFVIHTTHPATDDGGELYAEVVPGLGETLVGNHPGRALAFTWNKAASRPALVCFPSKSAAAYGGGLIFRSDSNGEDLAGYAGAGLYDSVMLPPPRWARLDYSEEPLVWNEDLRNRLFENIARLGLAVESALGSAQDIEGVVTGENYFLVQTRPQMGVDHA